MPLPLTASELNCAQNQGLWNADGINQPQDQQESCAIAKTTARCALYN